MYMYVSAVMISQLTGYNYKSESNQLLVPVKSVWCEECRDAINLGMKKSYH